MVIALNVRGFNALLYKVVVFRIILPLSIAAFFRSAKYSRKSYRVYSYDTMTLLGVKLAFTVTL